MNSSKTGAIGADTSLTVGMHREFILELNPEEAHIHIRSNNTSTLTEYCQRLFPRSYQKTIDNKTYIFFAEKETNPANAVGVIYENMVPNTWVSNRRVAGKLEAA